MSFKIGYTQIAEIANFAENIAEAIEDYNDEIIASDPIVQEILNTVKLFIKQKRLVVYGGTAMNAILPDKDKFYNVNKDLPDWDFFTHRPVHHAIELADILEKKGYEGVFVKSGIHLGTFKVFAQGIPAADITYASYKLMKELRKTGIEKDGVL